MDVRELQHESIENLLLSYPNKIRFQTVYCGVSEGFSNALEGLKVFYGGELIRIALMKNNVEVNKWDVDKGEGE